MTVTFGIGAFALSGVMATITYFTARTQFLNERQSAVQRQAFVDGALVQNALRSPSADASQILSAVNAAPGTRPVLFAGGKWYAASISAGESTIPALEREMVLTGTPATQYFQTGRSPALVVGVPLAAVHGAYFEVSNLDELQGTLRALALALAAAAAITTIAGAALGRWAAGRALRPLSGVSRAAVAIAGGELDTRVDAGSDADLMDLATSFNTMAEHLQRRIEREARFTSDVSHELRSPLTTLAASISVLQAYRADLPEAGRRALDLLVSDLGRFTRMVDDLLEISRLDSGSAQLTLDEVDPGELLRHAVASYAHAAPDPPIVVDPALASARLRVDKRRFERILANLLDNAAQYGGGVTRIALQPGKDEHTIELIVDDAGPGIDPAERESVFERFYRGRHAGRRGSGEGTGLGLALVAEHARLHGGAVRIESSETGGARFVVVIPMRKGAQ